MTKRSGEAAADCGGPLRNFLNLQCKDFVISPL